MFDFVHQEVVPAEDKPDVASAALIFVIICLSNLVFALLNKSFARALELMGQI
jgi:hypothetical protein